MQPQLAFCRNTTWKLAATSTCLCALDDDEDKSTAKLYVREAAQAADEALAANDWRIAGTERHKPDYRSDSSQDEDSENMDF